jgi:hypothetical protein
MSKTGLKMRGEAPNFSRQKDSSQRSVELRLGVKSNNPLRFATSSEVH